MLLDSVIDIALRPLTIGLLSLSLSFLDLSLSKDLLFGVLLPRNIVLVISRLLSRYASPCLHTYIPIV